MISFMTYRSRFLGTSTLAATLVLAACGTELDHDHYDHDHDYAEVTAGQGLEQGIAVSGAWSPSASVVAAGDQATVQYDGAPPYDGGVNCSGGATPGARTLRDLLIANYPQIGSVGVYNCRVISGTNSMSLHGVGRALDIMIPTVGGDANNTAGDAIAAFLIQNADALGLQLIIWDRTIWSTTRSPGNRVRAYTGSSPHIDHLHVEVNEEAAFQNLPWYQNPTGPGPAPSCDVVGADGIVDAGPCQQLFGPAQYWRTESAGRGGQLRWTNAFSGATPSNWARTTIRPRTAGRYTVQAFIDPAFGRFAQTRYRVRHAGGESVVVVDQARAPAGGGFVDLATVDVGAEVTVVVEDNAAASPPSDARGIVVDAYRIVAASTPPPQEPEPTPEEPTPTPEEPAPAPEEPEPAPTPTPEDPAPTPTPEEPAPTGPADDDIIDEGDSDDVLDSDDPGTASEIIVTVDGGCSQTSTTSMAPMGLGLLVLLRRRRRT
jgi:uncharacterized protein (TIGR03382 family)